ncbi:MAG: DUF5666 domain-containing protein [Acidobacteriaceae bacterium]
MRHWISPIRSGIVAMALGCAFIAVAQEPGDQVAVRGQLAGMQRVAGTVTAVSGDAVTVKAEDGTMYQVTTTPNTRLMKGQGVPLKVADLKPGDGVMAAGNMDAPNKTLHAAFLIATDAEQVKKMRENLGKTYIAGKVTAIDGDNLKMTVMRSDGVAQTIGLDETTSFKRGGRLGRGNGMGGFGMGASGAASAGSAPEGGESITLADIKVGDNLVGTGSVKSGVFVPNVLNVGQARQGHRGNVAPVKPQQ